jgi:hypothetical protein
MNITNKKVDAIRRLILGPLYNDCKENPMGVKREVLEAQFEELKKEGCIDGNCGFDEMIKLCQLKSHYPTCLSDNRKCIEDIGERTTGIKKFYYDQYKKAKEVEDESDESDEEDEIECPICIMNEDVDGVKLVENVFNQDTEQGPLSCGHLVHKSCLIRQAITKGKDKAECPLCHKVFELDEVDVPVRDRETRDRDDLRRAIFNATQTSFSFEAIANAYEATVDELLEKLGMTAEEASAYFSIPIEQPPVNRMLDFTDEEREEDQIRYILTFIRAEDFQEAIELTKEFNEERGNNNWFPSRVIRVLLDKILDLNVRTVLDHSLELFLLGYNSNIVNDEDNMDTFIGDFICKMFRASSTKKGIAKLILLHIIKKDSIGMYYILLHILKGYDSITPEINNEIVEFIFQAYNHFTIRNEDVDEFNNETVGNVVLRDMLNDVLDEEQFRGWRNMTDVSDLIRDWLRTSGEIEDNY